MKSLNYLLTRCLLIALAICSPLIALASTKINGLYYDLNTTNQTAAVVNSSNYSSSLSGEVVIPSTVVSNGIKFTVTSISNGAFARCASITSIIIPGTVTSIGTTQTSNETNLPFFSCTALKSVRFEDGTSDIYLGAYFSTRYGIGLFNSCPLEEVYIGRNIKYKNYSQYEYASNAHYYGFSAFYNQPNLSKVIIGEGCTELTDYLFYKNASITLMDFPNVKKIGRSTFEECSRLTTLNLGSSIEEFGDRCFYNCTYITKLTFPNSAKSIGDYAFYNCASITEVTVGNALKEIGSYAFYNCKSFTALILPDCFTTMGESAFEDCSKLTVAKLGQSLTSVPAKAFKNCTALSEMIIPGAAKSIGDQAFYNDYGLAVITMNEGLETIGSEVFYNNSGIMRFTIPGTVKSMGANCFYGCTNVSYLIFKDGIGTLNIDNTKCKSSKIDAITKDTEKEKRDRKYDYFYDCPIKFLSIGKNITYESSPSVEIYDPDKKEMVKRASAPFVNHKGIRSVTIGQNVTLLYNHLLNGCSGISEIILPSGMAEIYSYALANLPAITSLILPDPLTLFGDYACANNTSLTSIIFNEEQGNSLSMKIGDGALSNCPGLTELIFPGKTTSIGSYCFKNTPNITKVRFNDSSSSVSLGSGSAKNTCLFGDCELRSLYIGKDIIYSGRAFNYQTKLTDVRFSHAGTVTLCDDYLLYGVSSCKSLDLPESITELGSYAFAYMTALDGINIPSKVSHLPKGLFSNDTSLSSITIHPAVVKMDGKIFENCSSLTTVTFEGNTELLVMGYGASDEEFGLFRDCPLVTLNLNRWLSYNTDTPSRSPFYSIATLKNLNIGENVKLIDKYMFSYCTGLVTLNLNDNVESVGEDGFRGCTSLKSVRLSENLSQVSDYGFSECTSLENIKFPASMTSIADNSFSNCTSLKNVDLGDKLMIIGPSAFKNDSAIEEIIMPESLYGLGVEAFANCTSMRSVVIRGISSVGKQSFQGCTGLQWVSLSDKTTSLGEDSFDGCTGIKYVKSYAELPPEGFVNFPELVPQKGTLFVPKNSVDYYRYSPTWENWLDIRPLVLASSLELDRNEVALNVNEMTQLIATVGPADATEKSVIWKSSNTSVATVDANGKVTAVNFGDATITATTTDGSNLSASCKIRVTALAESITLNKTSASLKVTETIQLTATVSPSTATNKAVTWKSSNESIATVDANGKVTAVSVGEATITATTTDGSNKSATCKIIVLKTFAKSITLNKTTASLKATETLTLTATVLPVTTTKKTVTWKSSNTSVATVDANGKVTAIGVGEATITATTTDGTNLSASCNVKVEATLGDVNNDAIINVTDVMTVVSHILGFSPDIFIFNAADINKDSKISITDIVAIVNIILNGERANDAPYITRAASHVALGSRLFVDDCSIEEGETMQLAVNLTNDIAFSGFQADIKLPEGLELCQEDGEYMISLSDRKGKDHVLTSAMRPDGTIRLLSYSMNLKEYAGTEGALIYLTVKAADNFVGDYEICINNITFVQANLTEYSLEPTVCHLTGTTEIEGVNDDVVVATIGDDIVVKNAPLGSSVRVYAADGGLIASKVATDGDVVVEAPVNGVYVVVVDGKSFKLMVK